MFFFNQQPQVLRTASAAVRAYSSRSSAPQRPSLASLKEGKSLLEKMPSIPLSFNILKRNPGHEGCNRDRLIEIWKASSPEEKAPILETRKKAIDAKKAFIANLSQTQLDNMAKYKEARDLGTFTELALKDLLGTWPKQRRPSSFFVSDLYAKSGTDFKITVGAAQKQYGNLDEATKKKYISMGETEAAAFPAIFEAWKNALTDEDWKMLKSPTAKGAMGETKWHMLFGVGESTISGKRSRSGKRQPSGYAKFLKDFIIKNPVQPERLRKARSAWEQLGDSEKAAWKST